MRIRTSEKEIKPTLFNCILAFLSPGASAIRKQLYKDSGPWGVTVTLWACRGGAELSIHRKLIQLQDLAEGPREGRGFQLVIESSLIRAQLVQPEDYMDLPTSPLCFVNAYGSVNPFKQRKYLTRLAQVCWMFLHAGIRYVPCGWSPYIP